MKIRRMVGTNFLGALDVNIELDGGSVVLTGKNRAGKTSGLYLINAALEGMARRKVPWKTQPVHRAPEGEPQPRTAEAVLVLDSPDGGEVLVQRTFELKDDARVVTSLKIDPPSALEGSTPQEWLSSLFTANSMDPWTFARADADKQVEILCQSIGIEDQRQALVSQIADLTQRRRDIGRDHKKAKGEFDRMPLPAKPSGDHRDPSEVKQELTELRQGRNRLAGINEELKDQLQRQQTKLAAAASRVKRLNAELKEAIEDERREVAAAEELRGTVDEELKTAIDQAGYDANDWCKDRVQAGFKEVLDDLDETVASVEDELALAGSIATEMADYQRYQKLSTEVAELQNEYEEHTARIRDTEQDLLDLLGGVNLPVEGLALTPAGLMRNDVPLEQCSSSELLVLSVALEIAVMEQTENRLRVIVLQDGDKFDGDTLDTLLEMADSAGVQLIIEQAVQGRELAMLLDEGTDAEISEFLKQQEIPTVAMKDGRTIR